MRALTFLSIALMLFATGCTSNSRSDDQTMTPSLRTEYQTSAGVMPVQYETERAFAITQEALYWYSHLLGTPVQVSEEVFLSEVVPLIELDEGVSQMLTISEEEARRFYALVFAAIREKRETAVEELHAIRSSTHFRVVEQKPPAKLVPSVQ